MTRLRRDYHKLDELERDEVAVDCRDNPLFGDPHAHENGCYTIPAVSLTAECDDYEPEYILVWLPEDQMFGTWDGDHAVLTVFPGISWTDIAADPVPYLNAQWDGETGERFRAWESYEFTSYGSRSQSES